MHAVKAESGNSIQATVNMFSWQREENLPQIILVVVIHSMFLLGKSAKETTALFPPTMNIFPTVK